MQNTTHNKQAKQESGVNKPKTMNDYIEYFKKHGITKLPKGESIGSMYEKIEMYKKLKKEMTENKVTGVDL